MKMSSHKLGATTQKRTEQAYTNINRGYLLKTKLILQVIYCKKKKKKLVKQKELDTYTRNKIMHELLIGVNKKGKPGHGLMGDIAKKYDVHWKTVSRI